MCSYSCLELSLFYITSIICVVSQEIIFPSQSSLIEGGKCHHPFGIEGTCQQSTICPSLKKHLDEHLYGFKVVLCGWKNNAIPIVCCLKGTPTVRTEKVFDISPPKNNDCERIYRQSLPTYFKRSTVDILGVGGEDARETVTAYTVLLGEQKEKNEFDWYCGGVIINQEWILTAAHCFTAGNPKIVRLGEYDFSRGVDLTGRERPTDYRIKEVILYPEFKIPSAYHDLALIHLNGNITFNRLQIQPVCLPWGREASRNLVGRQVILTGWGATKFLGRNSPIIQEVNLTVFEPAFCDATYSTLRDYETTFPDGIHEDTTLCAGDPEGGKDACQGDSGGPIVYPNDEGKYTLAGIVSKGYGCGLKEFPGIYVPINNPNYLAWIKKIAF